jgi:hypothetical protein
MVVNSMGNRILSRKYFELFLMFTPFAWRYRIIYESLVYFPGQEIQNDATAYDDYHYESGDYVEEPQPSLIPQFTTEAKEFKFARDRLIRLPCRVDKLGKLLKNTRLKLNSNLISKLHIK